MGRVSSPIERIESNYTVVVIGSGYGGAIAASRMARAGQQVCVLERGKEFQPGQYPDTTPQVLSELQVDHPDRHVGPATGLYDVRLNGDIHVFVGCGLGGTSLVNANVSLRAKEPVLADPVWPAALREDLSTLVEDGYSRAEEMLKPEPYPVDFPSLRKLQALEQSASYLDKPFYRPPINVTFRDGVNHVGVDQRACVLCGDCVSGCNYAAKNTVLMNYLPDPRNHGAEIYTEVSVRRIGRCDGRWVVHYQLLNAGREEFDAPEMFVTADVVVLAAGTLGSTEVLLRSKDAGLPLSESLGRRFSGNGDFLGFGYNNDVAINGIGFGSGDPDNHEPVGPCITGIIDDRDNERWEDGIVVEDGAIPSGTASFLPEALAAGALLVGGDTDRGLVDRIQEIFRKLVSLVRRSSHGAVRNTQTYLVMAHDDAEGRMYLKDGRLRIEWPGVGTKPIFTKVNETLEQATRALGGTYVKNPVSAKLTGHDLITVHPLGGCVMAEEASDGVVNHKGQVYSGNQGIEVHEGLYVSDGSIIPRSLGVNPLLTISALAERSCALLAQDRGWTIDYDLPSAPPVPPEPQRVGLKFTETMKGYISNQVLDDFDRASEQGKQDGSSFQFTLTIISRDLDRFIEDDRHQAGMTGTVMAPSLSDSPLVVTYGEFNLFLTDPEKPNTRQMKYRVSMTAQQGKVYYLDGFKLIHDDPGLDIWSDTTTLFITVHDGDGPQGAVLAKGILRIEPSDFRRQMTNMKTINTEGLVDDLKAKVRFGKLFLGELHEAYAAGG